MKCYKCGAKVKEGSLFCEHCGARIEVKEKNENDTFGHFKSMCKENLKYIIILSICILVLAALISGITTYYVAAKPVLDMKYEYELKIDDANQQLKQAQEKYKEINNIKVNTSEPEKTQLQGKCTVGVDIAPGTYTITAKSGHVSVMVYENEDELKEASYKYRAHYYGGKGETLGQVVLKAGEIMKIEGEGLAVFTPEKEGE